MIVFLPNDQLGELIEFSRYGGASFNFGLTRVFCVARQPKIRLVSDNFIREKMMDATMR